MSQFYIGVVAGSLPPTVPTSFKEDMGMAIPLGNLLNVNGGSTSTNNVNGIMTTGAGNVIVVELTNRSTGTGTTTGAGTTTILTQAFTPPSNTYIVEANIAGHSNDVPASSAGFSIFATVRSDGTTTTIIGNPDKIDNVDANLTTTDANFVVVGSNLALQVTGSNDVLNRSMSWRALLTYTQAI